MLALADVLQGVGHIELVNPVDAGLGFSGVCNDSRHIRPGELFVALRAERDGHEFIADAFRRGAAGVLAERLVDLSWLSAENQFAYFVVPDSLLALQQLAAHHLRQHPAAKVVAVTGSVGKTTAKELIASVLAQRFGVLKSERNLNNEIGLPLTLLQLEAGHERVVLEMGMYALGEIAALCRIARPSIGVVTNVGPIHLSRLGTIERIAQAKSELVAALPDSGRAALNGDDPLVAAMAEHTTARSLRYGLAPDNDLRADDVLAHGLAGISFTLRYRGTATRMRCPMPGKHSVYACMAAAAVGLVEGVLWAEIERGLAVGPAHTRVVAVPGRNGSVVIDDTYNASPPSVIAALDLLAELPGRRMAILGDMFELGSYEEEGHRAVGTRAASTVDRLVVVGQRARWIGEQALIDGLRDVTFAARKEDVALELRPGDHVLVKGSRGMAMEQVVAGLRSEDAEPRPAEHVTEGEVVK